jgi:DNA gyrase/topoisomerase IV subunit A
MASKSERRHSVHRNIWGYFNIIECTCLLQAEAILSLTLRRLTALEENKLTTEHGELTAQIGALQTLMTDDSAVNALIKAETAELRAKYAVPRRSEIVPEERELADTDLLANDRCVRICGYCWHVRGCS